MLMEDLILPLRSLPYFVLHAHVVLSKHITPETQIVVVSWWIRNISWSIYRELILLLRERLHDYRGLPSIRKLRRVNGPLSVVKG